MNPHPALRAGQWLIVLFIGACSGAYKFSTTEHRDLGLGKVPVQELSFAVITPSTVTGQEEEKQSVAYVFAEVLRRERPNIHLVSLAETLSAVNAAGLADRYRNAYQEYRESGILRREALDGIAQVTGARYVVALKLSGFTQISDNRFGALGLRIVDTKRATVRLFLQIWDSKNGAIVWEGLQETSTAEDVVKERLVSFREAIGEAFTALIEPLPGAPQTSAAASDQNGGSEPSASSSANGTSSPATAPGANHASGSSATPGANSASGSSATP